MPAALETTAGERIRIHRLMTSIHAHAVRLLDGWIEVAPIPRTADSSRPLLAIIPIEGAVSGMIGLLGEQSAVRVILGRLLGEEVAPEDALLPETLAETLNLFIGNSTDSLRRQGLPIKVFPPFASPAEYGERLFEDPAYARKIETPAGLFLIIFSTSVRQ